MAAAVSSSGVQCAMKFFDAFNGRDFGKWSTLLADRFEASYPGAPSLNAEQARQYNESFLPAFPDLHFEVTRTYVDGDTVVMEWVAYGTHLGPLTSGGGQTIPPTKRSGEVHGVLISRIVDGKIAGERTYWDQMELLTQLGIV